MLDGINVTESLRGRRGRQQPRDVTVGKWLKKKREGKNGQGRLRTVFIASKRKKQWGEQVTLCLLAEDLLLVGFLSGPWRQTEKVLALAVLSTLKYHLGCGTRQAWRWPGDAKKGGPLRPANSRWVSPPSRPTAGQRCRERRPHWELTARVRREEFDKLCDG